MKVEVELHTDGITDICNEALKTGIFTASQKALADEIDDKFGVTLNMADELLIFSRD